MKIYLSNQYLSSLRLSFNLILFQILKKTSPFTLFFETIIALKIIKSTCYITEIVLPRLKFLSLMFYEPESPLISDALVRGVLSQNPRKICCVSA